MFWYPSIFVVLFLWSATYLWFVGSALHVVVALAVAWIILPFAWGRSSPEQQQDPVTLVSMVSSCVAVLWAPHLLLEWHRGHLALSRGLPNLAFVAFIAVYYIVYRERDHEHMLSGLFIADKYGIVLMFALLKVYKHAPTYLVDVDVLRVHVAQMIGVALTFTFNTSRSNAQGVYNTTQALVHQIATGIYAFITCLELFIRQVDDTDLFLHLVSYGLLALSFIVLNSNVKKMLPLYENGSDTSVELKARWFRFFVAVMGVEVVWMAITI